MTKKNKNPNDKDRPLRDKLQRQMKPPRSKDAAEVYGEKPIEGANAQQRADALIDRICGRKPEPEIFSGKKPQDAVEMFTRRLIGNRGGKSGESKISEDFLRRLQENSAKARGLKKPKEFKASEDHRGSTLKDDEVNLSDFVDSEDEDASLRGPQEPFI